MNFQSIEEVLKAFQSPEQKTHNAAEELIHQQVRNNFSKFLESLLKGVCCADQTLAELASVLLKKKYLDDNKNMKKITKPEWEMIYKTVKARIDPKYTLSYLRRISEVLAQVYVLQGINNNTLFYMQNLLDNYKGLVNDITFLSKDKNENIKLMAMYTVQLICESQFNDGVLLQFHKEFTNIFTENIQVKSMKVKTQTLKALIIFLSLIQDKEFIMKFVVLHKVIKATMIEVIKFDQDAGKQIIERIQDLTQFNPQFILPISVEFLQIMNEIIKNKSFDNSLRNASISALHQLCLCNQVGFRKLDAFKNQTVPIIMTVISEVVDDDLEEWNNQDERYVISKTETYCYAYNILPKISEALGPKFTLKTFIPYIAKFSQQGQWQHRFTAMIALGQLVLNTKHHYINDLSQLVGIIEKQFTEKHPKVIWANLTTLAFFCQEFAPEMQKYYHEKIMEYVMVNIHDKKNPRIERISIACLIDFITHYNQQEIDSAIIEKYSDKIFQALIVSFKHALESVEIATIQQCVTCLSLMASTLQGNFTQYYERIMPDLKNIIQKVKPDSEEKINVRVMTIETIGYFIGAIKDNQALFQKEHPDIMNTLIQLQKGLAKDDQHQEAIIVVYMSVALALGPDFDIYMRQINDSLLQLLDINIDIKMTEANNEDKKKGIYSAAVDLKLLGGKKLLSMNVMALQIKQAAAQSLQEIAKAMDKSYFKYVEKTWPLVKKYLVYKYSTAVRHNMMDLVSIMMKSCQNEDHMARLLEQSLPGFTSQISNYIVIKKDEEIYTILSKFFACVDLFTEDKINLNDKGIPLLFECMQESMKMAETIKQDILAAYNQHPEHDIYEQEDFEEQYDGLNDIYQSNLYQPLLQSPLKVCMEIGIKFLELSKARVEDLIIKTMLPLYFQCLKKPQPTDNEVLYSICLFDTFLDLASQEKFNQIWKKMVEILLQHCQGGDNLDVLQSAIWGLGCVAQRAPAQEFKNCYSQTLKAVEQIMMHKEAKSEDRIKLTDNAIGVLGKLGLFQGGQQVLKKFLELMPITADEEEAVLVNGMFIELLQAKNQQLMNNLKLTEQVVIRLRNIVSKNPKTGLLKEKHRIILAKI